MIDILFIHPNASKKIYQDLAKDFSAIEPPIWAGMLAQHCRFKGFSVEILDCEAFGHDDEMSVEVIKSYNPRFACFVVYGQQPSASTQNMEGATSLSKMLREMYPDIKIIFVGGHVAALPFQTMNNHHEIDFACTNEGVYSISELLIVQDDLMEASELGGIPGLVWRYEDNIVQNESASIVAKENLTIDLPGVAWDLLPMRKYRTSLWHSYTNNCDQKKFASIYTSLGCPFACTFCCINAPFGARQFRYWDPQFTILQLDKLAGMDIKNLKIADEMFVLNEEHFIKLCILIIQRGYKFNIWCYARIDTIKERHLTILKKAGVKWLGLGIESGVKKVRSDVIKGKFEEIDIRKMVGSIRDHDINVAANYIFGLPQDTMQSMEQTLHLAFELNTEMANFYSCMAYPGSPLHQKAIENKWKLPDSYAGYSQHSYECQPLPTNHVSAKEVLAFRDHAWMAYHSNENHQQLIQKKFGQIAVDRLRESTKIQLKRKILEKV